MKFKRVYHILQLMSVEKIFVKDSPYGNSPLKVLLTEELSGQEDVDKLIMEGAPKSPLYIYAAICRQGDTLRRFLLMQYIHGS